MIKPPPRLFRVRRAAARPPIDHRKRFRQAMHDLRVEDAVTDLVASVCVVCYGPAVYFAVWGETAARKLIAYCLCGSCGKRAGHDKEFLRVVEGKVIELDRAG